MATVKISELPAILGANTAATDVLPIVDVSGNITNKITREEFFKNIQTDVEIADKIVHSGDTNTAIRFPAADTVTVETSGAERLRVDSSGNVGIGTSSPAQELEIAGTEPNIRLNSGGTPSALYGFEITNGTTVDAYLRARGSTGETQLGSGRSAGWGGHLTFYTDTAERMRINSSGNVGIGTTSISYPLDVASASNATIRLTRTASHNVTLNAISGGSFTIGLDGSGGTTERMRIDSVGNVGIGTSSPSAPLHITREISAALQSSARLNASYTAGGLSHGVGFSINSNAVSAGVYVTENNGPGASLLFTTSPSFSTPTNTERMRIDASGNLGLGVTPSAWSWGGRVIDGTNNMVVSAGGTYGVFATNTFWNGTNWVYKSTAAAARYDQNTSAHAWFTAPSGTAGNAITFTQAMTLDASGNLGVGVTSPSARLQANNTINTVYSPSDTLTSGTIAYIRNDSSTNATAATLRLDALGSANVAAVSISAVHTGDAASALTFGTRTNASSNVTERARIDASGNITQANAVSGSGAIVGEQTFRLAANVTAFGPAIGDFFGATSAISLEASSVYEIVIYAVFTKTTAGTATWTLTASSAPTRMIGSYQATPITGVGAGASTSGFAGSQGATTAAFAATGSLTTAVNHVYQFKVQVQTNLATSFKLQLTQGAGTATPLAGSYYTVKKISATTGTFV